MRFSKIKIFRQNCLTYQMIDSFHSPLLESGDCALQHDPENGPARAYDCHHRDSENYPYSQRRYDCKETSNN